MPARTVSAQKIRNVITLHALSDPSYRELSRLFDVSPSTVGKYLLAFERSALTLAKTRGLSDQALIAVLSPTPPVQQPSRRHRTLLGLYPAIHQSLSDPTTSLLDQWKRYRRQQPHGLLLFELRSTIRQVALDQRTLKAVPQSLDRAYNAR